nr:hypothetical protein [Cyclobacteriaceae bacterium]
MKSLLKYLYFFFFLWIFIFQESPAQNDKAAVEQFRRDQELMKRSELLRVMDSAVVFMNEGKYELADQRFLYVLNNIHGVPSDLTFYFGKNSYFLGRFKQSVDWINKYIQMKGTTAQYSAEAMDILKK